MEDGLGRLPAMKRAPELCNAPCPEAVEEVLVFRPERAIKRQGQYQVRPVIFIPAPEPLAWPLFPGAQTPRATRLHKAIRSFRARPL